MSVWVQFQIRIAIFNSEGHQLTGRNTKPLFPIEFQSSVADPRASDSQCSSYTFASSCIDPWALSLANSCTPRDHSAHPWVGPMCATTERTLLVKEWCVVLKESAAKHVHTPCGAGPERDHQARGEGSWRTWFGSCRRQRRRRCGRDNTSLRTQNMRIWTRAAVRSM